MPTFAQFGTSEVSKSALVSQFVSTYEASGRKTASGSELRQLQEELERMVARASARVQQLEHSQAQVMRSRAGEGGGNERGSSKRDRDGFRLSDGSLSQVLAGGTVEAKAVSISAADSAAVGSSADSKAASKRAKSSSSLASQRVGGSDSEQSVNTSSKVGGDGKYFQAGGGGGGGEQSAMAGQAKARQHSTGTPVQEDFSRVKVTNQVQIQTFWASLEPYFRSITDEDIGFLESSTDSQEAYTVPRLGKFYARAWAEEEVTHFPDHMSNNKTRYTAKHLLSLDRSSGSQAAATAAAAAAAAAEGRSFSGRELVDSDLTFNSVRLAPLTERIISALVAERLVVVGGGEDGNGDSGGHMAKHQEFAEFGEGSDSSDGEFVEARHLSSSGEAITLEERLKRELRYIGILDESD
ncbi:Transcriptional regulator, partial [Coemansia sp. RSA 2320]